MTIMLVGGGSGGHITPLLAIAKHLKSKNPGLQIIAVTERRGKFVALFDDNQNIDQLKFISAGKFRRFHGESWWIRLTDIRRNLLNLRDSARLLAGVFQSFWMLLRHRPDSILIKGGYVGVPIGLAAWVLCIPYITHDSDALAGLSNRLIAGGAYRHAVGMPEDSYDYPPAKTVFVGIPVTEDFHSLTPEHVKNARINAGIPLEAKVVMITGGSNGAKRLNSALVEPIKELLQHHDDLWIIHQFGPGNEGLYDEYPESLKIRVRADPFLKPLSAYSAAADVIITRAGATTLAEFAAQAKACMVVPNPYLTGGHQLRNAQALAKEKAVVVLQEQEMTDKVEVMRLLGSMISDPEYCAHLGARLHSVIAPAAAEKLATLLLEHSSTLKAKE